MKLYIARDFNNDLFLYKEKPYFDGGNSWTTKSGVYYNIDNNLFPEIIFKNSPQEIELKLVNNKVGKGSKNLTFKEISQLIDDLI